MADRPAHHLLAVDVMPEKPAQSITLVFSAAETQAYFDKKIVHEATPADKNPSALKKLVAKATALKNNQDPFGELRMMKNDILALNKPNKRRGQKR